MAVIEPPVVLVAALYPTAVLYDEVVFPDKAQAPTAVFECPVVFAFNVSCQTPTLL